MRTLDEVIKANECCDHGELDSRCEDCPYSGIGACLLERETDALHYLREYKKRKNALRYWSEKAISEQQNFVDAYMFCKSENEKDNNPLTWDELKQMEGKPVWIEDNTGTKFYKGWAIILDFKFAEGNFMHYVCNDYSETCVDVEDLGKTWRAYRKERE